MQIEKRNIGVAILLTFVTCGIYGIIWCIKMMQEAVKVKDPQDNGMVEILLGIFLAPVGFYLAEKKLAEGCAARGIQHEDRSILYIVLGFIGLGIVDYALMQSDLNAIADVPAYVDPQPGYQQPQQPTYQQPTYQQPEQPQYPPYQDPTNGQQ